LVGSGTVSVVAMERQRPPSGAWTPGANEPARTQQMALAVVGEPPWGTLKGKVTFDGDPPEVKELPIDKDKAHCLCQEAKDRGDTKDPTWKIGKNTGVADVVVWLRAPKGEPFEVPEKLRRRDETVRLDQPYCAFEPHVFVLYPSYYNPARVGQQPTGQKFEVVNSATIAHNTKVLPSDSNINADENRLLPASRHQGKPEGGRLLYEPAACADKRFGGEQLFTFACDIHKWMRAYAWVFDHPFATVTAGGAADDKKFGTYAIQYIPLKTDLDVVYWHEGMEKPTVVKTVRFRSGGTKTVDLKIGN
jgi:hypothetical protein